MVMMALHANAWAPARHANEGIATTPSDGWANTHLHLAYS